MCVANPLVVADLDVTNSDCYSLTPEQGLHSAFPVVNQPRAATLHLPDYGVCAYDAGLTASLREAYPIPTPDRFALAPARWYAGPTPTLLNPGISRQYSSTAGAVLQVGEVGLEGNFSQPDEIWRVLPHRYAKGYSVELTQYVPTTMLSTLVGSATCWYWGARAANKFWQVSEQTNQFLLNTGAPLQESNPTNPLDGLQLHALALSFTASGSVRLRWLDEAGNLREQQTRAGVVVPGWQHLVLTWCPSQALPADPDVAECWPFRRGLLRLLVNGRQELTALDFPELRHRPLPGPASQQYSVPYFMSWGAGTPGWSHAYLPQDAAGTPTPLVYEPTLLEEAFGGLVPGLGLRRMRVYEGALTPHYARQLAADYVPQLAWGVVEENLN